VISIRVDMAVFAVFRLKWDWALPNWCSGEGAVAIPLASKPATSTILA
jgi:hypothetical protein